jgi:transposase
MGAPIPIVLSQKDRTEYARLCRSGKTSVRLKERLSIVLLADKGLTNGEISERLSISAHKVGRWRNRYAEQGLAGIEKNRPRGGNHGGKSSKEQARIRRKIIEKTTQEKPSNATHWSTRTLAAELGTSDTFVAKVWRECGFKPHLISQFKISNDPLFAEKLEDVVGLYLDPPENAVVFCVDEKSSIQALDRTQPGLPLKKGRAATMTHDYKRHGTSTLFAALNVFSGEVIGECKQRHRHQEFLSFLKTVHKQTPEGRELHVIVDNYSTHKHQKVKNWLKRNKRVHLHFIPTSSSWLNLVERFFGLITDKQIRRGVFSSVADLEEKIMQFISAHNENPKPFVWTKSVKEILVKTNRARLALHK